MKANFLSSAGRAALVSLLLGATSIYGSSSTGGAPGRSDVIKRREKAPAQKPVKPATDLPVPPQTPSQTDHTRFLWITPSSAESQNERQRDAVEHEVGPTSLSAVSLTTKQAASVVIEYGDVLNSKQKAILQERAEALGLAPGDYARLLMDDEKQRLDAMLAERRHRVTSGE